MDRPGTLPQYRTPLAAIRLAGAAFLVVALAVGLVWDWVARSRGHTIRVRD